MSKLIKSCLKKYNELLKTINSLGEEIKNNFNKEQSLDCNLNYLQNIQSSNDSKTKLLEDALSQIQTIKDNLLNFIKKHPEKFKLIPKELKFYEVFLAAVLDNAWALEFVQSKKLSAEAYANICLAAVQNNGLALRFVKSEQLSADTYINICMTAIQNDGWALEFVQSKKLNADTYAKIYLVAVQNNGLALQFVQSELLSAENYINICLAAAQTNGRALQHVKFEKLSAETYAKICLTAVQNNGCALRHVKSEMLSAETYAKICLTAVQNNGWALQFVKSKQLSAETYINFCLVAVQNNCWALQFVLSKELSVDTYINICLAAVQSDGLTLQHVKSEKLSEETYIKICRTAWEQNHRVSCLFSNKILEEFIKEKALSMRLIKSNYGVFDKLPTDKVFKVKEAIATDSQIIIVQLSNDHELEDIYRIYAAKHTAAHPVCVRTKKQLEEVLDIKLYGQKIDKSTSVHIVIIGHSSLRSEDISSFYPMDLVNLKNKYPLIKQFTLLGCNTAGSEKTLSAEQMIKEKLKDTIQSRLVAHYPKLAIDKSRLEKLTEEILIGEGVSGCGFGIVNAVSVNPKNFMKQLPELLDAAYLLVTNKEPSSYSFYYVSRDIDGTKSVCISKSLTTTQMESLKMLDLRIISEERDGYRLKNNKFISQKDYNNSNNKALSEIQDQLTQPKQGFFPNLTSVKKSLFDAPKNAVWAQNKKGRIAIIDKQLIEKIKRITGHHKTEFKERDYNKKQNNEEKPIYAQHITISSESNDFSILKGSLVAKTVNTMKQEGINDITIKGYRDYIFPSPSIEHSDTGRLHTAHIQNPFKTDKYPHTFFGSKTTNLNLDKLRREQINAIKEGRTKSVNIML